MWRLARAAVLWQTAAGAAEPGAPLSRALEAMQGTQEYGRAVQAMSEVMAQASEEARAFVEEKAQELGEEGAFEAALMEAFVAFDSDDDGRLIGQVGG